MGERYQIAIIGSGPAGLSAAVRAANRGITHILLEKTDHLSDTIFKYQKKKFVMATPDALPLQDGMQMSFKASRREEVLDTWENEVKRAGVNVAYNCDVVGVTGERGAFQIRLKTGAVVEAEHIVLAIGVQGNLNRFDPTKVVGADLPMIQYQLDDPEEYFDEDIAVIGVGDAGLENGMALSTNNRVIFINASKDELKDGEWFPRAKKGNSDQAYKLIRDGRVRHTNPSEVARFEPGAIVVRKRDGSEESYVCNRVIARIGAQPPRAFVEAMGVKFQSPDRAAFPIIQPNYETSVAGIYVIGALAGSPLIKHCMNQGFEVVEHIYPTDPANPIQPADERLLQKKLDRIAWVDKADRDRVNHTLLEVQRRIPLLAGASLLKMRELMNDSEVHVLRKGDIVFKLNDYGDSLFTILDGEVEILIASSPDTPEDIVNRIPLGRGNFFGEIGLIAGRRRSATVVAKGNCVLIELQRRSARSLLKDVPAAQMVMDRTILTRELRTYLSVPGSGATVSDADLQPLLETATVEVRRPGTPQERLIVEGERDDDVFIIRRGSVKISKKVGGREVVIAYRPAGHLVGEIAMLMSAPRSATVTVARETEVIRLKAAPFLEMLKQRPDLRELYNERIVALAKQTAEAQTQDGDWMDFLLKQGAYEATDMLLIEESLCVRCDNCEKACAESHDGISRLDREAGPTFPHGQALLHVPTSCRHCEHPHCMSDCPPDAIKRKPNGEVTINDSCIGCGNCKNYCPYGVIQLSPRPPKKPGLLQWLLFGKGPGPGEDKVWKHAHHEGQKKAVKCDMCVGVDGGPACVRACPTGAAIRVRPEEFLRLVREEV